MSTEDMITEIIENIKATSRDPYYHVRIMYEPYNLWTVAEGSPLEINPTMTEKPTLADVLQASREWRDLYAITSNPDA